MGFDLSSYMRQVEEAEDRRQARALLTEQQKTNKAQLRRQRRREKKVEGLQEAALVFDTYTEAVEAIGLDATKTIDQDAAKSYIDSKMPEDFQVFLVSGPTSSMQKQKGATNGTSTAG